MPYPDGTSAFDPNAPWNETEPPKCLECGGVWTEEGHLPLSEDVFECEECDSTFEVDTDEEPENCQNCQSEDIHKLSCPHEGLTEADHDEMMRVEQAEMRMEEERLE